MTINIDMTIEEPNEIDMAVTKVADTASFSLGSEMIVVRNHAVLENRDKANQHPISAITGLEEALDGIPTKTSDLANDSDFITSEDIPEVPTKTSELTNDSGYITSSSIPTKTSQLQNDSGYITSSAIPTVPTKTSQLQNDSGYITSSAIPTVPTKTSQLTNDSGFLTSFVEADPTVPAWAKASTKPTYTSSEVGAVSSNAIVTSVSASSTNAQVPSAKCLYDIVGDVETLLASI